MAEPPRPPRMTITRLDTGTSVSAQFNPDEVKEELAVNYAELAVLGLSHKPMHYTGTSNLTMSFDLGFDVLSIRGGGDALKTRIWLHSVCYGAKGANNISSGGPPDLRFFWPGLYSVTCKLVKLGVSLKRFNSKLLPTHFVASISLTEIRTVRLFSSDVLANGTMRA